MRCPLEISVLFLIISIFVCYITSVPATSFLFQLTFGRLRFLLPYVWRKSKVKTTKTIRLCACKTDDEVIRQFLNKDTCNRVADKVMLM